jgi:hypothetical protein
MDQARRDSAARARRAGAKPGVVGRGPEPRGTGDERAPSDRYNVKRAALSPEPPKQRQQQQQRPARATGMASSAERGPRGPSPAPEAAVSRVFPAMEDTSKGPVQLIRFDERTGDMEVSGARAAPRLTRAARAAARAPARGGRRARGGGPQRSGGHTGRVAPRGGAVNARRSRATAVRATPRRPPDAAERPGPAPRAPAPRHPPRARARPRPPGLRARGAAAALHHDARRRRRARRPRAHRQVLYPQPAARPLGGLPPRAQPPAVHQGAVDLVAPRRARRARRPALPPGEGRRGGEGGGRRAGACRQPDAPHEAAGRTHGRGCKAAAA